MELKMNNCWLQEWRGLIWTFGLAIWKHYPQENELFGRKVPFLRDCVAGSAAPAPKLVTSWIMDLVVAAKTITRVTEDMNRIFVESHSNNTEHKPLPLLRFHFKSFSDTRRKIKCVLAHLSFVTKAEVKSITDACMLDILTSFSCLSIGPLSLHLKTRSSRVI